MYNIKEILSSDIMTPDRISELSDFLEDLFQDKEICEKHGEDLRMLLIGPHFDENTLKETGIRIKYDWSEISKAMDSLGISFHPSVTEQDIVYTVNMLCTVYCPLITDVVMALKFAEKYIKDPSWPVEYGKSYLIWKFAKDL